MIDKYVGKKTQKKTLTIEIQKDLPMSHSLVTFPHMTGKILQPIFIISFELIPYLFPVWLALG